MASGITVLGCPLSSYLALQSACPATNIPVCATATPQSAWDRGCCSSLATYGSSVGSCYAKNAPACLDTSAATGAITGSASVSNPCIAFLTAAPAATGSGSSIATTTPAAGATVTGATSGASLTGSAATTSSTTKSAGSNVGPSLKLFIGVGLISAFAVLNL